MNEYFKTIKQISNSRCGMFKLFVQLRAINYYIILFEYCKLKQSLIRWINIVSIPGKLISSFVMGDALPPRSKRETF